MRTHPTENTEESPKARRKIEKTLNGPNGERPELAPRVLGEPFAPRGPRKEPLLWSPPKPGTVEISHKITKVPDAPI